MRRLEALGSVVRTGYGKDWAEKYSLNYKRYLEIVQANINRDGVLDPHDRVHVAAMSRLLATRMVYGAQSEEYREELEDFNDYRQVLSGNAGPKPEAEPSLETAVETPATNTDACPTGSRMRVEADQLWAEAQSMLKHKKIRSGHA